MNSKKILLKRNHIKSIVGWLIILGHISLGASVIFAKDGVFDASQKISILLVLGPVFSMYFVSVVRDFIANSTDFTTGEDVNWNFVGIALIIPSTELLAVHFLIFAYPNSIAADVDSLQRWISGLEVFLGGSVGLLVENLFPRQAK